MHPLKHNNGQMWARAKVWVVALKVPRHCRASTPLYKNECFYSQPKLVLVKQATGTRSLDSAIRRGSQFGYKNVFGFLFSRKIKRFLENIFMHKRIYFRGTTAVKSYLLMRFNFFLSVLWISLSLYQDDPISKIYETCYRVVLRILYNLYIIIQIV